MTCFSPDVGMNSSGRGGAVQPEMVRNLKCEATMSFEERHWDSYVGQLDSWVAFLDCEEILDSCTGWCCGVSEIHFEEFGPGGRKGLSLSYYSLGLCICAALKE